MMTAEIAAGLRNYIEGADFAGYDPYDALNSPIIRNITARSKWMRVCAIQGMRRLPLNLRKVLATPKGHNPKGLGLFLEGYCRLAACGDVVTYLPQVRRLIELLRKLRSQECTGNGWGYNFDWQTPVFYVPKYVPTVVNSAFIGHALLDAYETFKCQEALDLAVPIKDFILNDLNRTFDGDTFCFSYTPLDQYSVHNANFLGASLLIRLWKIVGEACVRDAALASLGYGMKHQRRDGSWYFSQRDGSHWIDSFHTGFNLEAIRHFLRLGEAAEFAFAYEKGVRYYADNFFLPDGTPKYYHDRTYPIDIHAPAEAIVFFSAEQGFENLTDRVMNWTLKNMADSRGYFYFRKGRYFTNRIPYMRWGQAWAFRALTAWAFNREKACICAKEEQTARG